MAAKKRKRVEESAVVKDRAVRFLFTKSFSTADRPTEGGGSRARAPPRGDRLRAGRGRTDAFES
jgi:hypothetical protein